MRLFKRLAKQLLVPKKAKLISRAKGGDPVSIGLVIVVVLYRIAKMRSSGKVYKTKLMPGQTVTISNIPKSKSSVGS